MSSSSSAVIATASKAHKCDVCTRGDGVNGHTMIRCTDCRLAVHKECYGLETYQKTIFTCWACRAVGQRIPIDAWDKNTNKRLTVLQETRPTKCDLCSVQGGIHAMHPIYDNHGKSAYQMHRMDGPYNSHRLVWAHSLCAFFLTTQGLMYGCAQDGTYDGEDSDASEDERSYNPVLIDPLQLASEDYGDGAPVHHFVYYLKKPGREHNDWTKVIADKQQYLRCYICGKNDHPKGVLRIPLQCFANDEEEHPKFKGTHQGSLGPEETCVQAMHVGCARWGGHNPTNAMRLYSGGGIDGIYCNVHAEDILRAAKKKEQQRELERNRQREKEWYKSHLKSSSNSSPSSANRQVRSHHDPSMPLASLNKLAPAKKRRNSAMESASSRKRPSGDLLGASLQTTKKAKPSKPKWHDNLDRGEAVSVSQVARPLLKDKRKELANQRSIVQDSTLDKILINLIAKAGQPMEPDERRTIVKSRKSFWKRELSELTSDDFKGMWSEALKKFHNYLVNPQSMPHLRVAAAAAAARADVSPSKDSSSKSSKLKPPPQPSQPRQRKRPSMVDLTDDPPAPAPTPATKRASEPKKRKNKNTSAEPEDAAPPEMLDEEESAAAATRPQAAPPAQDNWDHLIVGKDFHNSMEFTFGEWDDSRLI